jgi:hypothetical protein
MTTTAITITITTFRSFVHSSMFLQPFLGPWPLPQFRDLFKQSVGLLGRGSARRKAATYTQNNRNTE